MRVKKQYFGILLVLAASLSLGFSPTAATAAKDGIKIHKGKIEEAADLIARFPTEEEARETFDRLNGVVENFRSVLAGEKAIDLEDIEDKCRFVLETHKKTEIMEWCLLGLCLDGTLSLLPGEGIELTIPSYCLDAGKAGPALEEFYSIEKISGKQGQWLTPLLDYVSGRPNEDLPVQGLIWNMGKKIPFDDLPEDQQDLLAAVVPDAAKRYNKKPVKKLLGRLADEVKSRVDIIRDVEYTADRVNRRKSRLKLVLPKHDTFRLNNGLLVRIKSTGSFKKLTLVVVNPREEVGGAGTALTVQLAGLLEQGGFAAAAQPGRIAGITRIMGLSAWTTGNQGSAFIPGFGRGLGIAIGPTPTLRLLDPGSPLAFAAEGQGKWGKGKNWWNENKGKIGDWSDRAGDAKDVIDSYNEGGLDGVRDYAKGRGFDESLDVFKSFSKGNPEAERAFELFRDFNKGFLDSDKDKEDRGENKKFKPLRPSKYRFKPGRGDVQPLAGGGY